MLTQEIIRTKREGGRLGAAEIECFVTGMVDQSVSEGQVAALAMAIFFNGLEREECIALTNALQGSGRTLDWAALNLHGPVVDKHSTGGVGDKVSLMLAPMLAACGAYVPMISGRGLGHTGGTLDKMDSIPGYNTSPDSGFFQRVVKQTGCAIVGQTAELAPADKRLYAIRDVTATVESIPLITASILSKKLAAGLDALVMDIKTGSGAFAASYGMAEQLADSIVAVGSGLGLPITALITDMSQVLGSTAGNALEVDEVVRYLRSEHLDPRLHQVVIGLGAELLVLSKLAKTCEDGERQLDQVLADGSAAEYFAHMVAALGGPADIVDKPNNYLNRAAVVLPVYPKQAAVVSTIDVRAVGNVVVELGGGRRRAEDSIDHAVGLSAIKGVGESVESGEPLAIIYAATEDAAQKAQCQLQAAFTLVYGRERLLSNVQKPSTAILKRLVADANSVVGQAKVEQEKS